MIEKRKQLEIHFSYLSKITNITFSIQRDLDLCIKVQHSEEQFFQFSENKAAR
jgi:hypothetical protein